MTSNFPGRKISPLKAGWIALCVSFAFVAASPAERVYSAAATWDFDSINPLHPTETANQVAAGQVYVMLVQMNEFWNAHELEAYLGNFWESPSLVVVEDGVVYNGWQNLHDKFVRGFTDLNAMGRNTLTRVQVRMLTADTALALEHWTVAFAGSSHVTVGIDTAYLQRVGDGWKIVTGHTSLLDM